MNPSLGGQNTKKRIEDRFSLSSKYDHNSLKRKQQVKKTESQSS